MTTPGGGSSAERVGTQREVRSTVRLRLHGQDLSELDVVDLEAQAAAGEVHAPDAGHRLTLLGHALVPVLREVARARTAGHGVVLPLVLLVARLEADVLHLGDDPPRPGQVPVGAHVAVAGGA